MYSLRVITLVACLSSAATSLSAASYTFDLQRGGDPGVDGGNTFTAYDSGLTAIFGGGYFEGAAYSGGTLTSGTIYSAYDVVRNYNGLGVCNDGPCYSDDPVHSVDGLSTGSGGALTDYLTFSVFDGANLVEVQLTGLLFGWVGDFTESGANGYAGSTGAYEILIDSFDDDMIGLGDALAASGVATAVNALPGIGTASIDLEGLGLVSDLFGLKAGVGGSWKLRAVTIEYTPGLTVVPLPAAGWLLLGGVAGLVTLRRRKKV